ncbi:MAG: hypothetical protein K9N48_01400 [Verrucomicrobia bacterium]|nr:hypothetical protein [Verrucomicrobiota bacterium]
MKAPETSEIEEFSLIELRGGGCSIRSETYGETFHPVVGPGAEARALYVEQLHIERRLQECADEFVVWDVGLGAGANALAVLDAARDCRVPLRLVSFDRSLAALSFGLSHAAQLGFYQGFEELIQTVIGEHRADLDAIGNPGSWRILEVDFPKFISDRSCGGLNPPDAIIYDAYSPAKNPDMWTFDHFCNLRSVIPEHKRCSMATYSRSTMLRVALLLAGFYVGRGGRTGEKEETTIAATDIGLIRFPLDSRWLRRAEHSTNAEPLMSPEYTQKRATSHTLKSLRAHPQFGG